MPARPAPSSPRSIAALARPVIGIERGSIVSPAASHSAAIASASARRRTASTTRAGVLSGSPVERHAKTAIAVRHRRAGPEALHFLSHDRFRSRGANDRVKHADDDQQPADQRPAARPKQVAEHHREPEQERSPRRPSRSKANRWKRLFHRASSSVIPGPRSIASTSRPVAAGSCATSCAPASRNSLSS